MPAYNNKGGGLSWSQPPENKADEKKSAASPAPASPEKAPARVPLTAAPAPTARVVPMVVASFVVGIVVGVLVGWAWFVNPGDTPGSVVSKSEGSAQESEGTQPVAPTAPGVPAVSSSSAGISVASQPAGSTVAIASVSVASPSWVVVYESRNGARGNALGAKLFAPEEKSGVVYLLRSTTAGQTYFVGQRLDNGDRVFSMKNDMPAVDSAGKLLVAQFKAN